MNLAIQNVKYKSFRPKIYPDLETFFKDRAAADVFIA